jgi:uncharacterized protein (UPF0548 family)
VLSPSPHNEAVSVTPLAARDAAALESAPLTYGTAEGVDQPTRNGFHLLQRTVLLRRRDLEGAAADLFAWRMHERAGLAVRAGDIPLRTGTVVVLLLGWRRAALRIPCRVVDVIEEPRRRGFSYGTLPGHPESGEEQFLLELQDDGRVRFTITAFSRPASRLARLSGPAGRAVQWFMTKRYLRALDRL